MCVFIRIVVESDRGEESSYKAHYGKTNGSRQVSGSGPLMCLSRRPRLRRLIDFQLCAMARAIQVVRRRRSAFEAAAASNYRFK